jgi:hypothetical protein
MRQICLVALESYADVPTIVREVYTGGPLGSEQGFLHILLDEV